MRSCVLVLLGIMAGGSAAYADTVSYANSTNPVAFFPLQSQSQGSTVNGYATTYMNGASDVPSNGGPQSNAVSFNGVNNSSPQYVGTSLSGEINGAGSISAYINLAAPVSGIDYIAGESQGGNDFDFQIVGQGGGSEALCFYTDAGSSTCATLTDAQLVGNWNMVTATYDSSATGDNQDVYLDGMLVATNGNASGGTKVDQFTIGYSTTFGNRDFDGLISDVGVWNYQLSAAQVAGLYAAGTAVPPPPTGVTPEPSSIALLGTGLLGFAGVLKRRFV